MSERISQEIANLALWMSAQCRHHAYGTFGIEATVHAGRITRIERHAVVSVKPGVSPDDPIREAETSSNPEDESLGAVP